MSPLQQAFLALVALPLTASAVQFTITDIEPLGGNASYAAAINASGQVVGQAYTGGVASRAFLYTKAGGVVDLGTLGGTNGIAASGINNAGEIVGYSPIDVGNTKRRAFRRLPGSTMLEDLGTLGGNESFAYAVNAGGHIVGQSDIDATHHNAFLYTPGSGMTDLGTLGGKTSYALAINAGGIIVGSSYLAGDTAVRPCIFENNTVKDLGTFGGTFGSAAAINDDGAIVGNSFFAGNMINRAFIYTKAGGMKNLGTLGTGTSSGASGINNDGAIVGSISDPVAFPPISHAFLYVDGKMKDLDTLVDPKAGWAFESASAINATHQITGYGQIGGSRHSFILTPVKPSLVVKGSHKIKTHKKKRTIRGTADGYLTGVVRRVGSKGAFHPTQGPTAKWHFAVNLKKGLNRIFVRADGPAGNSKLIQLTITRK